MYSTLIYSIIFFMTPLASQALDPFLEYKSYDPDIMRQAHEIFGMNQKELESYVKKSYQESTLNNFENASVLIDRYSRLYSELFKIAKELQQKKNEELAQGLSMRILLCVGGFVKGLYGSAIQPFLHPIGLAWDIKNLIHLIYDLGVRRLVLLNEYYIWEDVLSVERKEYIETYLEQCDLMDLHIWDTIVQKYYHIYDDATNKERAEFLGNIVGFLLFIFIFIKLISLFFKFMYNAISLLIKRSRKWRMSLNN